MGIEQLNGRRIVKVTGCEPGSDQVSIYCADGSEWSMYHSQDCCESVDIVDVVGDVDDLCGLVIDAREESRDAQQDEIDNDSGLWTFYIVQTDRGAVTLRWLGTSNGYYSERVDFECLTTARATA